MRRRGKEEKEESIEGATSAPPREPEAARGVPRCREAPYFDATPPLLPLPVPPTSSLPRQAFLHHRLHLLVVQTVVERILIPKLCGAWPSRQGRSHPRAPCRVAAVPSCCVMQAFEPGWEAVSCSRRCRLCRVHNPLAVLSFALSVPSFGRCVTAVAVLTSVCAARSFARTRAPVHPHTCMRMPGGARSPLFARLPPRAELAGVPPAVSRGAAAGVGFPP
jgi:hypothetical protein